MNCHVTTTSPLPRSYVQALRDPNCKKAMLDEYNALITNETWVLVPRLANLNPPGFVDSTKPDYVCHLQKSLYGLKQALSAWFQRFASFAIRIGFHHSKIDASLFVYHRGSDIAYLLLYVDDIILTALSTSLLQRIIDFLHGEFAMTDLGSLNYFLGTSAQRTTSGLFLSQSKFAEEILEKAHKQQCNPCRTPVDTKSKIGPEGAPVADPTLYCSPAEALQYLMFTRPDLSYVVQQLHASSITQLVAYTDADWAFAEAKYHGVANVAAEIAWIRNLLQIYAVAANDISLEIETKEDNHSLWKSSSCVIPVKRGYWGNLNGKVHNFPIKVTVRCRSVTFRFYVFIVEGRRPTPRLTPDDMWLGRTGGFLAGDTLMGIFVNQHEYYVMQFCLHHM
nr:ribonuclease H-like domain-containing protein [Tanacetum cinerariifolium]